MMKINFSSPIIDLLKGPLKVEFFFGRIFLSYKGILLTKKFGMYSSIFCEHWHDSRTAIWHIIKHNSNNVEMYGNWSFLPISQRWQLELTEQKITWSIKMEALEEFTFKFAQQNIMVSELYDSWEVPQYAKGKFPPYFANYEGIVWDRIWSMPQREDDTLILLSDKAQLPALKLVSKLSSDSHLLVIENSDPQYEARLLSSLFVNKGEKTIQPEDIIEFAWELEVFEVI